MMPPWAPPTITGILKREVYKQEKPGRIIEPRQWHAIQRSMADRRKRAAA